MATPADLLAATESAISKVLERLATGDAIVEITEGPIRVKRESPTALLRALREMRDTFAAEAQTTRSAAVAYNHGVV